MKLPRPAALLGLATSLALVFAACSWSVPADPGANARLRGHSGASPTGSSGSPSAADDGARAVYVVKCAQCHEPFSPRHASAAEWPAYVRKYGPRAGLFGEERERVLRWLQANAR